MLMYANVCAQAQYTALADNLQELSRDLVDCIRNGEEQKVMLRAGRQGVKKDKLARLKLGIHYKHKQVT